MKRSELKQIIKECVEEINEDRQFDIDFKSSMDIMSKDESTMTAEERLKSYQIMGAICKELLNRNKKQTLLDVCKTMLSKIFKVNK